MASPEQLDALEQAANAMSRAIYRRLTEPLADRMEPRTRQRVLDACELTMRRISDEPNFARPSRFLFEELRPYFPLYEQLWVRTVVDRHVTIACEILSRLPRQRSECGAFTRAGESCRREPVAGSEFCPSHRHLEKMDSVG